VWSISRVVADACGPTVLASGQNHSGGSVVKPSGSIRSPRFVGTAGTARHLSIGTLRPCGSHQAAELKLISPRAPDVAPSVGAIGI